MAFNKIQPEQIQLATFFSSSGDINISQSDTGVGLNLSRNITGDFAITGDSSNPLVINKRAVFTMPPTGDNTVAGFDSGTFAFNGSLNVVSGTRNIVVNGYNDSFSGNSVDNVSVNGSNQVFGSGVEDCTALAGNGPEFTDNAGAVIISDGLATTTTAVADHSMTVDFASGTFFDGGATRFLSSYYVSDTSSGLNSGDLNVLGNTFLGTNAKMPLFSGQSVIAESGVFMYSGGRPIYHDGTSWVGIKTEPI